MIEPAPFGDPSAGASGLADVELDRICLGNLLGGDFDSVYFKDLGGRFVRASAASARVCRVARAADMHGKTDFDFFGYEQARSWYEAEQEIIRSGEPIVDVEEAVTWPGREDTWVLTTKQPLRDHDGKIIGLFGVSRDITERRRLSTELETSTRELARVERELRNLLESSPDPMIRYDTQLRHVYLNPAATALLQADAQQVVGRTNRELGHLAAFVDDWEAALRRALDTGQNAEVEFTFGGPMPRFLQARIVPEIHDGTTVSGVFVIARDLTDRKRAEDALAAQAVQDSLTGVANRLLLTDRVQQALVRLERAPGRIAILFIDLDRFKVINDSLGHAAGDAVLIEVAKRLRAAARRSDTVARFGGDEFVMLCERISTNDDVGIIAGRISRVMAEPVMFDGHALHISGSIGIAITDDPAASPAALLRDADAAMYQAKEHGRGSGSFQFFDAGVRERAVARMTMEGQLRRAIEQSEFRLHYQPLFTLGTERRLIGMEALIRWMHPDRGILAPAVFMALAEDTGLIVPIGKWVLNEACGQLARWNALRPPDQALTVAINLSERQLSHPDLVSDVAHALRKNALQARLLTLEMTETALLEEVAVSADVLGALHELGVQLALDDFGTGYSSLGHLRRFPLDILKIDHSFVKGLDAGNGDAVIVAAVTAMAHALGMTTIGKGIETIGQLTALGQLGCDDGQGYLMSRALTAEDLEKLLLRPAEETAENGDAAV